MTNERAVEILNLDLDILGQYRGESAEAYKMAIKALEQQSNRCDSCTHSEEQDGSNCYECVKGMADNFEAQPKIGYISIDVNKLAKEVAEKALDEITYEGKTIREWAEILVKQQPSEDCVSRSELQKTMDSLPLFRFVNNDHEEADDYYNCESVDMVIRNLPSVTPRTNLAETSQDCISREEMLKYQQYLHGKMSNEENHKLWNFIKGLPSVTPKYTDEEIDKAQAVEQAYVDKMVELAVEESKRPKGKWIVISCEPTDIFKCSECGMRVINPYRYCPNCGAEMSGGEEDETDN